MPESELTTEGRGLESTRGAPVIEPRLWPWALGLIAIAAARVAVAAAHPLYETEAYYWLWSRRLGLGYFDHPPMLAWAIRLADFFGPPHSLAARLHALLGHFLISILLYLLARNLFGSRRIALRAALLFNVIPIFSLAAIQNQPDAPMLLFWSAALVALERALTTGRPLWWIAAGLAAGGAMLSKFHAFFFVGCVFLFLLTAREGRSQLARPWPWLAFAVAVACYSPNFRWNATHDWMTYDFQFIRSGDGPEFSISHPIEVLLTPAAYLTPWIYALMLAAGWTAWRRGALGGDRAWALTFWASISLFLFFLLLSFTRAIKMHWHAPAWLALCPAAAVLMEGWRPRRRAWFIGGAAAFSALIYAYLISTPAPISPSWPNSILPRGLRARLIDPDEEDRTAKLFGWNVFGERLREEIAALDAEAPTMIVARRFDRAAAAAFYSGMPERAFVLDPGPEYRQSSRAPDPRGFLAWDQPLARSGANAIYVFVNRRPDRERAEIERLRESFGEVSDVIELPVAYRGVPWRTWKYVRARGYRPETKGAR
jgi:hypothetical protein